MNEIIDQMVELYFLGGNIYEMLAEYKLSLKYHHVENLFQEMFKSWR